MTGPDLAVTNARIVLPEVGIVPGTLVVRDGKVAEIRQGERQSKTSGETIDVGGRHVLPGFLDAHVHSGLLPPLEQRLQSESAFSASGGVTTVIRYFRRPESYLQTLPAQVALGAKLMHQDFAHHLVLYTPEQAAEMERYVQDFGVTSFKLYSNLRARFGGGTVMDQLPGGSGSVSAADVDFDYGHLYNVMRTAARLSARVRINVHAEDAEIVAAETERVLEADLEGLPAWHAARPDVAEGMAIGVVSYLSRHFRVPVYFPHVGSREGVRALFDARERGTDYGAEICPHYVALTTDSPAGARAKVQPPIRTPDDHAWVWRGIAAGVFTSFGSDHIASTLEEKNPVSIWDARPGFGGTGMILPVFLSEGVNKGRMTIRQLAELGSLNTARLFGLYPVKGTLQPGSDADFVVVDTDAEWTVDPADLLTSADYSVYDGLRLRGRAVLTAVRGTVIYRDGVMVGEPGHGRYLRRYPAVEHREDLE